MLRVKQPVDYQRSSPRRHRIWNQPSIPQIPHSIRQLLINQQGLDVYTYAHATSVRQLRAERLVREQTFLSEMSLPKKSGQGQRKHFGKNIMNAAVTLLQKKRHMSATSRKLSSSKKSR